MVPRGRSRTRRPQKESGGLTPQQQREVSRAITGSLRTFIEPKVTYVSILSQAVDFTGGVYSLTRNLTQGDNATNQATGNRIKPSYLELRYTWSTNQTYSQCRLIVFQWADQQLPNPSSIVYPGSTGSPLSPLYWPNITKIHVLHDSLTTLVPHSTGGYGAKSHSVRISGMKTVMLYPGLFSQPQMYGLYAMYITDDSIASFPVLNLESALVFTDA